MNKLFKWTLGLWIVSGMLFSSSCKKQSNESPIPQPLDSLKQITSFILKKANGSEFANGELAVTIQGINIDATIPWNTNLSSLIPSIKIKGKAIAPASELAQNFNQPVTYTVTAMDGSTVNYIVSVRLRSQSVVFVGSSNNTFYALDALTGSLVWKYESTAPFSYSSASYANGTVYVGGIDNNVYAFDAITGSIRWKKTIATTGIESDVVLADGTLYVGTNDDDLFALDATTGQEKWKFHTDGNVSASPTVSDGVVYFGSSDGKLYALLTATGQLKWSFQTGAMINQSEPALANGVVYVGSRDSYLYAIQASTGALVWKYSTNGISLESSSPAVASGNVYIGGWYDLSFKNKGSLYAVNAITGELVWEKLQDTGISSNPSVADSRLYITSDDLKIHALNAITGASLWEKLILANSASPVVADRTVYVGGGGTGYFYALDAYNGTEKWKFPTPKGLMTSKPLIVLVKP